MASGRFGPAGIRAGGGAAVGITGMPLRRRISSRITPVGSWPIWPHRLVSTCAVNFNSHTPRTEWLAAAAVSVKCRAARRLMRHSRPLEYTAVVTPETWHVSAVVTPLAIEDLTRIGDSP